MKVFLDRARDGKFVVMSHPRLGLRARTGDFDRESLVALLSRSGAAPEELRQAMSELQRFGRAEITLSDEQPLEDPASLSSSAGLSDQVSRTRNEYRAALDRLNQALLILKDVGPGDIDGVLAVRKANEEFRRAKEEYESAVSEFLAKNKKADPP